MRGRAVRAGKRGGRHFFIKAQREEMKLTDVGIRRVNGNGKVQKPSDGNGLFLYATPTGKTWRMAYRFRGK